MRKDDGRSHASALLRFERTQGDFPHARRPSAKLACCTTTTTCFIFAGAAVGTVVGCITGIVKAIHLIRLDREHYDEETLAATFLPRLARNTFRFLLLAGVFAFLGLLVGAAIGFIADKLGGIY